MSIKVVVLTDFVPEELVLAASPQAVNAILADIMAGARAFWIQKAGEKLHSSRRDYIDSIEELELNSGGASVALVGNLAHMIEDGADAFDMHDTLLGPNVPIAMGPGQRGKHVNAKGQFYRAIPFRHQVPGTAGLGGGPPMGSAYAGHPGVGNSAALGRAVHAAAKQLSPTVGMPGAGTSWGGRLDTSGMKIPLLKPIHSTDIYSGMVRQQKTYARASQNTYTTFRMISESQPDKFLHPGIAPAHIADAVHDYVERIAGDAFRTALGDL